MNMFNWAKGIGFGVVIWAIMLGISLLLGWMNVETTVVSTLIVTFIAGLIAYLFARTILPFKASLAWGYGFVWAFIGLVLDYTIVHNFNTGVLAIWQYWLPYVAVLVAPLVHLLDVNVREHSPQFGSY